MSVDYSATGKELQRELFESEVADEIPLLESACAGAKKYLERQRWCGRVIEAYVVAGVAGIVTCHLMRVVATQADVPEWICVFEGDMPPAYLRTDEAADCPEACQMYLDALAEWVRCVRAGEPLNDLIPVNASPTLEHAKMLEDRLEYIRTELWTSGG